MNKKNVLRITGLGVLVMFAAACSSKTDVDDLSIGQDIALTRADGALVEGTVTGLADESVQVKTGEMTKSIPNGQIVDLRVVDGSAPVELPAVATFREYTIPEGTKLSLTLSTPINSGTSQVEDRVGATLGAAVSVGNAEVLPTGSSLMGTVSAVEPSAKVKGVASIALHFSSVAVAGHEDSYDIDATYSETAEATKGADAAKIGIGAGAGAVVGGLIGGTSGAAKGAVIGGGAGAAVVLNTKGQEVVHAAGTTLTVTLRKAVDVRVPIG